jgi:hypothetical protein
MRRRGSAVVLSFDEALAAEEEAAELPPRLDHCSLLCLRGGGRKGGGGGDAAAAAAAAGRRWGLAYYVLAWLGGGGALAASSHARYAAEGLKVLPLPTLLALQAGLLLGAPALVAGTHAWLSSTGGSVTAGGRAARRRHQLGVSAVLGCCGAALAVAEAWLDVVGYCHLQLWLLPLAVLHSGPVVRSAWAAAIALGLPLLVYASVVARAAAATGGGGGSGVQQLSHFTASVGLGGAVPSASAAAAAWVGWVGLSCACAWACVALRTGRAEREAWGAARHVHAEESAAEAEAARLERVAGLLLPPSLLRRLAARGTGAGRRRSLAGVRINPAAHSSSAAAAGKLRRRPSAAVRSGENHHRECTHPRCHHCRSLEEARRSAGPMR